MNAILVGEFGTIAFQPERNTPEGEGFVLDKSSVDVHLQAKERVDGLIKKLREEAHP
jgi:hypothetical protein